MISQEIRKQMIQYNGLFKEMDDVYHSLAAHYGLSDTALWILYIIRESQSALTQSRLCEKLSLSKQTVNSALKKLERSGHVLLESLTGNQKNKQITLTAAGEALCKQTVDHIFTMEQHAFQQLSQEERALFLRLNELYVALLQKEAEKILDHTTKAL